jgi:hypothetical protein
MPRDFFQKYKVIILLVVCLLAVGEGLYSSFAGVERGTVRNRYTDFVLSRYERLDDGEYEKLAENYIEGLWEKQGDEYVVSGIMGREEAAAFLKDDLGVNGWRIRFVILQAIDYYTVSREAFPEQFKREAAVLDVVDPEKDIEEIHIVVLTGHVTGRCTIVDWVRPVPVVRLDGSLQMIIRGMPEVYYLLHKEQWFKPLHF